MSALRRRASGSHARNWESRAQKELCQGAPPSYVKRPYPCPQARWRTGAAFAGRSDGVVHHATPGHRGREALSSPAVGLSGVQLKIECFVPLLRMCWWCTGTSPTGPKRTRTGTTCRRSALVSTGGPIRRSSSSRRDSRGIYLHEAFLSMLRSQGLSFAAAGGQRRWRASLVEQSFPPDSVVQDGFPVLWLRWHRAARYTCQHAHSPGRPRPPDHAVGDRDERTLFVRRGDEQRSGGAQAGIGSHSHSSIGTTPEARPPPLERVQPAEALPSSGAGPVCAWRTRFLENLWYETLHARRCAFIGGTLFHRTLLPSTVARLLPLARRLPSQLHFPGTVLARLHRQSTSNWETPTYRGMDFMLQIGPQDRSEYYGCRGVFIQLKRLPDRCPRMTRLGFVPMGRRPS